MISVVVTCYNKAEYIEQAIRSVMKQTLEGLEILVVDDGSTDGSSAIIKGVAEEDSHIRVFETGRRGSGAANARNKGLYSASREWVLFLDGDDWLAEEHLEKLALRARNQACDIVYSRYCYVTPDGEQWGLPYGPLREEGLFELATMGCIFAIHAAIVRTDLALEVGGFSSGYEPCEDWDFWQKVLRTGARCTYVADTVAPYRMMPASAQRQRIRALLANSYRNIEQGARPDRRVVADSKYANGAGHSFVTVNKFFTWAYTALFALVGGVPLAELPPPPPYEGTDYDVFGMAQTVYYILPFALCRHPDVWPEIWSEWRPRLREMFWLLGMGRAEEGLKLLIGDWPEIYIEQSPRAQLQATFVERVDPWHYRDSPYEQVKYEQTMELLPHWALSAAELGCAEGVFTAELAKRVGFLDAVDFSSVALERARICCAPAHNIQFHLLDIFEAPLPGRYDLIVCSEVLYHVDRLERLEHIADKLHHALKENGRLVMTHAKAIVDSGAPAFNWNMQLGVETITQVFGRQFSLVQEIETALYRVQRYEKRCTLVEWRHRYAEHGELDPRLQESVVAEEVQRLPILLYHGVGPQRYFNARWEGVPLERFKEQMGYLAVSGYVPIGLGMLLHWLFEGRALPDKAVMLTFDDAEASFVEYALPVLWGYGFQATLFVPAGYLGKYAGWDYGPQTKVMTAQQLVEVSRRGVGIGSHGMFHLDFGERGLEDVVVEAIASKAKLEAILGYGADAFAYPYGVVNPEIQAVVGGCGYRVAFGAGNTYSRRACEFDNPLALPRIPVVGTDTLHDFEEKLR